MRELACWVKAAIGTETQHSGALALVQGGAGGSVASPTQPGFAPASPPTHAPPGPPARQPARAAPPPRVPVRCARSSSNASPGTRARAARPSSSRRPARRRRTPVDVLERLAPVLARADDRLAVARDHRELADVVERGTGRRLHLAGPLTDHRLVALAADAGRVRRARMDRERGDVAASRPRARPRPRRAITRSSPEPPPNAAVTRSHACALRRQRNPRGASTTGRCELCRSRVGDAAPSPTRSLPPSAPAEEDPRTIIGSAFVLCRRPRAAPRERIGRGAGR